jgi:hypothetical protein
LDTYYVVVYLMLAILAGTGLRWVWVRLQQPIAIRWVITLVAVAGLGWETVTNFGRNDEHDNYLYQDYTQAALNSLPQHALVVSHQWDFLISPAWYLQSAEKFRQDIVILEYEMFRARHWYAPQFAKQAPDWAKILNPELKIFANEVSKFDLGKPHDVRILSQNFDAIWRKLFAASAQRPVYIAPEMVYQTMARDGLGVPPGYDLVPETYFYRIVPLAPSAAYRPMAFQDDPIRFPAQENYYTQTISHQIALLAADRARYELAHQQRDLAKQWKNKAERINPGFNLPPELLGL